jgi:hypothetical protein
MHRLAILLGTLLLISGTLGSITLLADLSPGCYDENGYPCQSANIQDFSICYSTEKCTGPRSLPGDERCRKTKPTDKPEDKNGNGTSGKCMFCDGDELASLCFDSLNATQKCESSTDLANEVKCGQKRSAKCVLDPRSATGAQCVEPGDGDGSKCKLRTCLRGIPRPSDE